MLSAIPLYDKTHKDAIAKVAAKPKLRPKAGEPRRSEEQPEDSPQGRPDADVSVTGGADTVSLRICDESGLLSTAGCPSTSIEHFSRGTEPSSYCPMHRGGLSESQGDSGSVRGNDTQDTTLVTVTVCRGSGLLAGPGCPRTRKRIPIGDVPTRVCEQHNSR